MRIPGRLVGWLAGWLVFWQLEENTSDSNREPWPSGHWSIRQATAPSSHILVAAEPNFMRIRVHSRHRTLV